ncbi:MAG: SGNH/GDSL hydrolase family protein [Phycisphaerae bacterium]|nr:SGNH/GDSL hydrolase family protein [Phycisphaerae bacterium]
MRTKKKWKQILKKILLLTVPSLLFCLILLEIVFRFVIPADNPPAWYFDEAEKLLRYDPAAGEGLKTAGRFAEIRARWRINNMGWNSPIDYSPRRDNKLIAVIGDSYVEALQVDVGRNYPYLLREKLQPEYDVYAFGMSGAPLSQYLHVSRYVGRQFQPDVLIFNLIHNDFNESLRSLWPEYYFFLQLAVDETGAVREIPPTPILRRAQYRPWWQKQLLHSALFRYLHFNLDMVHSLQRIFHSNAPSEASGEILSAGLVETNSPDGSAGKNHTSAPAKSAPDQADGWEKRIQGERNDIFQAARYVVEAVRRENPERRIIFVMDAPRPAMYDGSEKSSSIWWMNEMMRELCAAAGVEFIDLTEFLQTDYRLHGKRFEFTIDGHWNAYGHQRIAEILHEHIRKNQ